MKYSEATSIRRTGLGSLISDRLLEGRSVGSSIGRSISDKFKAQAVGLKQKVHPVYIAKKMTGSNLAAALVGRAMGMKGRKIRDVSGQTHYHRHLEMQGANVLAGNIPQSKTLKVIQDIQDTLNKRIEFQMQHQETQKLLKEEMLNEQNRRDTEIINVFLSAMNKPQMATKAIAKKPETGGFGVMGLVGAGAAIYGIYNQFFSNGELKLPEIEFDMKDLSEIELPSMDDFEFDFDSVKDYLTSIFDNSEKEEIDDSRLPPEPQVEKQQTSPATMSEKEVADELQRLQKKVPQKAEEDAAPKMERVMPISGELEIIPPAETATPVKVPEPPKLTETVISTPKKAEPTAKRATEERKNYVSPDSIRQTLVESGISDPVAISNILAQVQAESNYVAKSESMNYKPERLISVFGNKYIKNIEDAKNLVAQGPEAVANRVYGGRLGNAPNEGYKYRGRGLIQITGKYNYAKFGKMIGVDLVNNPELANDPAVAKKLLVAYFKEKQNSGVNLKNISEVTKAVGPRNLKEQIEKRSNFAQAILKSLSDYKTASLTQETNGVSTIVAENAALKDDMKRRKPNVGSHTTIVNNNTFTTRTTSNVQAPADINPMLGRG